MWGCELPASRAGRPRLLDPARSAKRGGTSGHGDGMGAGRALRRGKFVDVLEPGRHRFWWLGHDFFPMDMRSQLVSVPPQEIATSDGVTVKVSATLRIRVVDPVATSKRHGTRRTRSTTQSRQPCVRSCVPGHSTKSSPESTLTRHQPTFWPSHPQSATRWRPSTSATSSHLPTCGARRRSW